MLNRLDTPGGHILICMLLLFIGAGFHVFQIPKAEDLIVFALGVLARSMIGRQVAPTVINNNSQQGDSHA